MMIRNIVFDIGMVLVDFRWQELMHELGITGEAFEHVSRSTVLGPYWNEFDRSRLASAELIEMCCRLDPDYSAQIRLYFDHIGEICREYPDSADWIRSFKAAGYRVYLLSNYARLSFIQANPPFTFLPLMDGGVISYEVQQIKPEPAIYQSLLKRCQLKAEECVFIDDNADNIKTASALGFRTVHYKTRKQADQELKILLAAQPDFFTK